MEDAYKIVESHSLFTLKNSVLAEIRKGYVPVGGFIIVDVPEPQHGSMNDYHVLPGMRMKRSYCQAMYNEQLAKVLQGKTE